MEDEADSDDENGKMKGKMPFASNVHTAARNNYFNKKINAPVTATTQQPQATWQSIQQNEMSQLEQLDELLIDEDVPDSVSNSSDDYW